MVWEIIKRLILTRVIFENFSKDKKKKKGIELYFYGLWSISYLIQYNLLQSILLLGI